MVDSKVLSNGHPRGDRSRQPVVLIGISRLDPVGGAMYDRGVASVPGGSIRPGGTLVTGPAKLGLGLADFLPRQTVLGR